MTARVIIILCVDSDPDRPEFGGARYDSRENLTWRWLPELAHKIQGLRRELFDKFNVKLRITWFLRSDIQIKLIYGDAAAALKMFDSLWDELAREGDELGWHPHSWRWSEAGRCWYNETSDTGYMLDSYDVGFEAFKRTLGFAPFASRAGISFHTNATITKLDQLGVRADLSANPGLRYYYARPESGSPVREGFDWSRTAAGPYHPSRLDYQTSKKGESLDILEIPMTVFRRPLGTPGYWKGLIPFRIRGKLSVTRPNVKGWFIPKVWGSEVRFEIGMREVLARANRFGLAHYASYFHPDDLTDSNYQHMKNNLAQIIQTANEHNVDIEFATASQACHALQ